MAESPKASAVPAKLAALARAEKFDELKDALADLGEADPQSEPVQEAFFRSVASEDTELIDRFLALGADINGRWRNATVLTLAAKLAEPEYLVALLDRGCDVNVQNAEGDTALISVCQLVRVLGLDDAYLRDSERLAEILIARGIDVNVANTYGDTALDVVCSADWRPWPAMVRLLLKSGARVECCNNVGAEALSTAACYRTPDVLKLLLDAGADPNGGPTANPLMIAAAQGQVANVKILLKAGADPNAKDIDGVTAVERARRNGHEDVVKALASA